MSTAAAVHDPGLTSVEAAVRLATHGPNQLPQPGRPHPLAELARQMVSFFAVMLWVAAGLALIAGMPALAVAVAVVVVINGLFAFAQEYRADRAAERLRDLLPARVTVRRDGRAQVVEAADLVVGDVVILEAGDRVSADLRLAPGGQVGVDESMLTGESVTRTRDAGSDPSRARTSWRAMARRSSAPPVPPLAWPGSRRSPRARSGRAARSRRSCTASSGSSRSWRSGSGRCSSSRPCSWAGRATRASCSRSG